MVYTIKYKPAASRQIAKLNKSIQARLKPKIAKALFSFQIYFALGPLGVQNLFCEGAID